MGDLRGIRNPTKEGAIMGGQGSGRKPLPDSGKRVRLSVEIAPQTYAGLCREGARERMAMGRLLDKVWNQHIEKNTH
jgi:hypothetical protein